MLYKHTDFMDYARTYNTPRTLTSPTSHSLCLALDSQTLFTLGATRPIQTTSKSHEHYSRWHSDRTAQAVARGRRSRFSAA